MSDIPEGFHRVQRPQPNPFNELVGPFYSKRQGKDVSLGLRIEERHTNSRGICHGGLLATMADLALGYACLAIGGQTSFVTVNLSLDFAGSAKAGDWVESQAEVQKAGSRIAFANCFLVANGVRIVRASAIFALSAAPK
jgi:acyl-coenzyme A thioesterase 13